jgi:dimethylargininase
VKHFEFNRAIVRTPPASVVSGLRAGGGPDPSLEGVRLEHAAYVAALEQAGLAVTTLPPLEAFPDSVFVEDPALVFTNGAILLRPGAPTRSGEVPALEPHLRERFETVLAIEEGHVDGGDVLVAPGMTLIGLSARTDRTGAEALVGLLARLGRQGNAVATPPSVLHLKSGCSLLDEQTVLATPALAASGMFDGFRVLVVPDAEEAAANVLRLNDTVLASTAYPLTLELLDGHGFNVIALPTAEVGKLDAGLTCMSLRWHAGNHPAGFPGGGAQASLAYHGAPTTTV